MAAQISLDNTEISSSSTYTFLLYRMYDDGLAQTPWASSPVPSDANATIKFPQQYSNILISGAICLDVSVNTASVPGFSCSI